MDRTRNFNAVSVEHSKFFKFSFNWIELLIFSQFYVTYETRKLHCCKIYNLHGGIYGSGIKQFPVTDKI